MTHPVDKSILGARAALITPVEKLAGPSTSQKRNYNRRREKKNNSRPGPGNCKNRGRHEADTGPRYETTQSRNT